VGFELRAVPPDDPAVIMLVGALRNEVDARHAHAGESAAELRKPVADAVKGDGDVLVPSAGPGPVGVAALRAIGQGTGEIKRM